MNMPERPLDPPESRYAIAIEDDQDRYDQEFIAYSVKLLNSPDDFATWAVDYLAEKDNGDIHNWAKLLIRSIPNGVVALTGDERREFDKLCERICEHAAESDPAAPAFPRTEQDFEDEARDAMCGMFS